MSLVVLQALLHVRTHIGASRLFLFAAASKPTFVFLLMFAVAEKQAFDAAHMRTGRLSIWAPRVAYHHAWLDFFVLAKKNTALYLCANFGVSLAFCCWQ